MSNEIVARDEKSLAQWSVLKDQAALIVKSGLAPGSVKTAEQALVIILTGRELGIPPMVALRKINVINGNPTLEAELMLGMCVARIRGFKHKILSEDADHCTFWAARPVEDGGIIEYTGSFTGVDAKQAGLANKQNWQLYRGAMLRARAISLTLRVVAPDVIMGLYTPDEMGATMNPEGEVIEMEPPEVIRQRDDEVQKAGKDALPPIPDSRPADAYQCSQCDMKMHDPKGKLAERSETEFGTLLCKQHGIAARKHGATYASGKWSNEIGIEADTLDALLEQCGSMDDDAQRMVDEHTHPD